MENSTEVRPINLTKIRTELALNEVDKLDDDPNDTSYHRRSDPNDTSTTNNDFPALNFQCYNRKVCRYAKKHNITEEEAFKRLYK